VTQNLLAGRDVIFEFAPMGNLMRVSAMDVATLTEAIVSCPIGAGEGVFRAMGSARLVYLLKKKEVL
jgi:hypothetical protein